MEKVVLISGAGTGIGKAMAIQQAKHAKVILCGRREDKLIEVKTLLNKNFDHIVFPLDVTNESELKKLDEMILGQNLVAVIANHGVGGENHFGEGDRFDFILDVNLKGTYSLVNTCLKALKKSTAEYKHIIVTSSILAKMGVPGYSAYCASKAALLGLTRSWATEFARDKILVNAICPGWVDTAMAREGIEQIAQNAKMSSKDVLDFQMNMVPLKKMSETQELADLCDYLVSDKNRSITGQSIDINNGALMV